jgi:ArsR family transcriptional regulator, lead/cadmium/zinc/bismuth-responsive transcriptional repressor
MDLCCSQGSENFKKIESSINILKAFSDPTRIRILCSLSKQEICVCDLAVKLGISRHLLSFHLKNLYDAEVLIKKRKGNKIFFYIKDEWQERVKLFLNFIGIK